MNQIGESGITIERFTLVGESLPSSAKQFRFFWLTGNPGTLYACFVPGIWTPIFGGGSVIMGGNSAPANNTIANSQAVLWFDPTPGAACLNVKAKDSAGNIVTAQIFTN